MEPKGSLLHSQRPATCPYPEPGKGQVEEQLSLKLKIFNFCTSLTFTFLR